MSGVSRVLYDDIGEFEPGTVTVLDAAGRALDSGDLNNYTLTTVATVPSDYIDEFNTAQVNVKRHLDFLPFDANFKLGGLRQEQTRDLDQKRSAFTFVGPDGLPNTADDNAGRYLDPQSVGGPNAFGVTRFEYPSIFGLWNVFQSNPNYFAATPAQQVAAEVSRISSSRQLNEKVTAGYVQGLSHIH
ncbi:MAG: hypothetical protein ACREF9_04845, partial [Opitutaceae bacterium]